MRTSRSRHMTFLTLALGVNFLFSCFRGELARAKAEGAPEIPVPPMPAARKATLGVPKLIDPAIVKATVRGLGGFVNSSSGVASLNGRVPAICVPYLSLRAGHQIMADGSVPFALMGSEAGVECLQKNGKGCDRTEGSGCVSFQALARSPQTKDRFEASVQVKVEEGESMKVALAKKAMVMNDSTTKMEASADCCAVAVDPKLGDEKPLSRLAAKNVADIGHVVEEAVDKTSEKTEPAAEAPAAPIYVPPPTSATQSAKRESSKRKSRDDEDDEDGDEKEPKRDPRLQKIKSDAELEAETQAAMKPLRENAAMAQMQAQLLQQQIQLQGLMTSNQMLMQRLQTMTQLQQPQPNQNANGAAGLMNYNWPTYNAGASWLTSPLSTTPSYSIPSLGTGFMGTQGR